MMAIASTTVKVTPIVILCSFALKDSLIHAGQKRDCNLLGSTKLLSCQKES